MPNNVIITELTEHTIAVIWRYMKSIVWIHVRGLLGEAPSE